MLDTHFQGPATNGYGAVPVQRGLQTLFGKATGTLTSNNTNVSDGATVTIGTKTYTFKTALTPTEGEVLIGADADGSLLNLIRAINHSGTPGTDYSVAAANAFVTAATSVTAHAFLVTAIVDGIAGNIIVTTETAAGAILAWGAATLTGGVGTTTTTGAGARRLLVRTIGATAAKPIRIELENVVVTAFNGTSPEVAIISENIDGTGTTTERSIASPSLISKIITVDKKYFVQYTAPTGSPTQGNIWSFAKVSGIGST